MAIGIDLGTTNTAVACDGRVIELTDAAGKSGAILPSVVAFPPTGKRLVGAAARRRRVIDARNTIFSAKRLIGRGWYALEVREFQGRYPFELVKVDGERPAFKTRAGVVSPTEIATIILATVREQCPPGSDAGGVVVAVPSAFGAPQREATAEAARQAGFRDVRIVDEPVATAWAYLHGEGGASSPEPTKGGPAVVYDLGGGTFSIAVLDTSTTPFKVLRHAGDPYLGGDDVDQELARWASLEVLKRNRWDLRSDAEVYDRLIVECERAKLRLSYATQSRIELSQVDPAAPIATVDVAIDRARMAAICTDLVRRTFTICDEVLAEARVKARDVETIFLAGGSTQLPPVREAIEKYFGRPARSELDPLEVVAMGASRVR